jgi:hypothetical protein
MDDGFGIPFVLRVLARRSAWMNRRDGARRHDDPLCLDNARTARREDE